MEDVEKAIAKRGAKRRRARIPVYSQGEEGGGQEADLAPQQGAGREDGQATRESPYRQEDTATGEELGQDAVGNTELDSEVEDEFEKLYEELEVCGGGGGGGDG